jgi:hypothetical protein
MYRLLVAMKGFTMEKQEQITSRQQSTSLDADKLKGKAVEVAEQIKARGKDQLEAGKKTAAAGVEQLAGALDQATQSLERGDQQSLAGYAQELAASVRSFANNLRDRSVDDLVAETQTLARRNPSLFFFGSIAVGIALSRFLKASGQNQESQFSDNRVRSGMAEHASNWQVGQESPGGIETMPRAETQTAPTNNPICGNDIRQKGA